MPWSLIKWGTPTPTGAARIDDTIEAFGQEPTSPLTVTEFFRRAGFATTPTQQASIAKSPEWFRIVARVTSLRQRRADPALPMPSEPTGVLLRADGTRILPTPPPIEQFVTNWTMDAEVPVVPAKKRPGKKAALAAARQQAAALEAQQRQLALQQQYFDQQNAYNQQNYNDTYQQALNAYNTAQMETVTVTTTAEPEPPYDWRRGPYDQQAFIAYQANAGPPVRLGTAVATPPPTPAAKPKPEPLALGAKRRYFAD